MRISAKEGHPSYSPASAFYEVRLNGQKVDHCETADTEEGWCELLKLDERGYIAWPLEVQRHHGTVQLIDLRDRIC